MKLHFTLIFSAISLAFLTGYLTLFLQGNYTASDEDIAYIHKIKYAFQREIEPIRTINIESAYFLEDQLQLLDPLYSDGVNLGKKSLFATNEKCFKNILSQFSLQPSFKEFIWEEFRCGMRKKLPKNFFLKSPFLHSSGFSYAYLAYSSEKKPFINIRWINNNLSLFHVNEIKFLIHNNIKIAGTHRWISERDQNVLSGISKGKNALLSKKYLFLRVLNQNTPAALIYRVFDRAQLEKFVEKSPYTFGRFQENSQCLYKDQPLCWNYNSPHLFQMANTSTKIIFIGTLILIILVIFVLFNRLKIQKIEEERKRMALQVLTHEFRTPIASLLLQLGHMDERISKLDEETQDDILRISNDVYRLQRLAEKSKSYLNIQNGHNLFHFQVEEVPSINDFFMDFLIPYQEKHGENIKLELLPKDSSLCIDTYWFAIILKNLIENAIDHGAMPIIVSLKNIKSEIKVSVLDHGECLMKDIDEITTAFYKGQKSKGTGLGMNIVKRIVTEMGGKLKYNCSPTEFIVLIKNMSKGK